MFINDLFIHTTGRYDLKVDFPISVALGLKSLLQSKDLFGERNAEILSML